MHEREKELILLSQKGDKEALSQILNSNKRTYMEYSKKISWKRI